MTFFLKNLDEMNINKIDSTQPLRKMLTILDTIEHTSLHGAMWTEIFSQTLTLTGPGIGPFGPITEKMTLSYKG